MVDIMLAVCKAHCDRCHEDTWLYLNDSKEYGLLCEDCMNKIGANPLKESDKRRE